MSAGAIHHAASGVRRHRRQDQPGDVERVRGDQRERASRSSGAANP